jgi:hypothetical protein
MADPFTLEVPADARFRVLAPELAGRYVEIVGGSDSEREACRARLADVIRDIAPSAGETVYLRVRTTPSGIEAVVTCDGESRMVTVPLPASMK